MGDAPERTAADQVQPADQVRPAERPVEHDRSADRAGRVDWVGAARARDGAGSDAVRLAAVGADGAREAGDAVQGFRNDYRERLDTELPGATGPATPRDSMSRVSDSGLVPRVDAEDADGYLFHASHHDSPWLRPADAASTEAQRIIVAVDQGDGHHLQRHEGEASGEGVQNRVETLRDPANAKPESRARGDDAFHTMRDQATGQDVPARHKCAQEATCINDPDAFATAVARALQRPDVCTVLERSYDPDYQPDRVKAFIEELLGPGGHEFCEGYRLRPIDGSAGKAMQNRAEWVKAGRECRLTDAVEPKSDPIDTFEGGMIDVFFKPNTQRTGYEISTMYPNPPTD